MTDPAPEADVEVEVVLVVDDDAGMRETLRDVLATARIPAAAVGTGTEARARQGELHPALAIVDDRLPDTSGVELAASLRAADPDLAVIILTGYASVESAIAAVGQVDDYLTKPVPPDVLLRDVGSILERRRLRVDNRRLTARLQALNASLEAQVSERTAELTSMVARLEGLSAGLARSEERFRTLVELAPDAMVITDADGQIVLVNAQTERLFARDRQDLVGQRVETLLPDRHRHAHLAHRARYLDDPQARPMGAGLDLWGKRGDGTEFPVDVSLAPLTTGEGLLLAAGVRDATDRKANEEALRQAADDERAAAQRLREADRLKDEFLAIVSHELRTPLTAIAGFAALLHDNPQGIGDQPPARLAERINANAAEMTRMVEQLLDFSRLQAGRVELRPRPLELAPAIAACVEQVTAELATHPLDVQVPDGLHALADPDGLDRILVNFLTNAAKFSPPDTPVHIRATATADEVVIEVIDKGPGIPVDEQARLFERFYQASPQAPGHRGTGLGLAIARRYAELQGGRVWAHSIPGHGSTFAVALPQPGTLQ